MKDLQKVTLQDILLPVIFNSVTTFRNVSITKDEDYLVLIEENTTNLEKTSYFKKELLLLGVAYWYIITPTIQLILDGNYKKLPTNIKDLIANSNPEYNKLTKNKIQGIGTDLRTALSDYDLITGTTQVVKLLKKCREELVKDLCMKLGLEKNEYLPNNVEIIQQFTINNFRQY